MKKLSLSFYTNIPTPNQDDFFEELSRLFHFNVIFYEKTESDRNWVLSKKNYKHIYLSDSILFIWLKKIYKDFHFSWGIFKCSINEKSQFVILSGNYFALNTIIAFFILKIRGKKLGFFSEKISESIGIRKIIKKIILFPFLKCLNFMIFVGACSKDSYNSFGFHFKHYVVIPYNINNNNFKREHLQGKKLIEFNDVYKTHSRFTLLTSGALIERKGIDFAIKIIELARNSISENIQLLILGEGPLKKSLQHLAKEQSVYLLGFKQKDEIPYYFNISDLFLFCSRYDGWGLVINEAISTGLPCLVSKDVGSSELIVNHANGFVCENACLQTYVDAIKLLYNDRILLKSISQNNQQLADTINSAAMAIKLNLFLQNNF